MYPFTEGSFAVRNGWYVAAFAQDVQRSLLSRWILNEPVVLYRTEAGEAVAVAGRCPHRHFPLGQSRLSGDEIICGYHGITFGPDGLCTRVPSQQTVPGVYKIRKYPLVERGLWLWIWPGDPALADEALLPNLQETGFHDPRFRFQPYYTHEIAGRYQLLNDNLLDLTHLAVLHRSSIGVEENASIPEEREEAPGVLRSRRRMQGVEQTPGSKLVSGYEGVVDRVTGMDFYLPGFHAGLDDTHVPRDHPTRGGEALRLARVFHAVTPGLKNTTHYFFAMGGNMTDEQFAFSKEFLKSVIDEDIFATVEIEKMLVNLGHSPAELMLRSDTGAVRARRLLQAMMDKERAASTAVQPAGP